jgi:hypothetical protein
MMSRLDRALFLGCLLHVLLSQRLALGQAASPEVGITGAISSSSIRKDELLPFTLTIKNKSDAKATYGTPLRGITLLRMPDSYVLDEKHDICVLPPLPPRKESCGTYPNRVASPNLLAESLAPGGSLTVQGYLRPTEIHRASLLTMVVGWTVVGAAHPSVQVSSSVPVTLGENQVRSTDWIRWPTFDEFMKILAVPALLVLIGALVGFILDQVNKNRDERMAATERERESVKRAAELDSEVDRRKHDQDQSVRAETWNQMLPIVHKYTTECYLPLSSAADRMRINVRLWQQDPRLSTQKVAFFYLLFVGKKMTITRDTVGGFYFKDLRGEMLASECWRRHRRALLGRESTKFNLAVKASVGLLDERETYQNFEKKFAGNGVPYVDHNLQEAWDQFRKWLTRASRVDYAMQHLLGFCLILDYELNRPYDYWYDPPARLSLTLGMEGLLRRIAADSDYRQDEVDEYFSKVIRPKN